eukprot:scaffold2493_cov285-Prasinococcus_capsulatus_cf.AAC.6
MAQGEAEDLGEDEKGSSIRFCNKLYPGSLEASQTRTGLAADEMMMALPSRVFVAGSFHPSVRYLSVCGNCVKGSPDFPKLQRQSIAEWFAFSSYQVRFLMVRPLPQMVLTTVLVSRLQATCGRGEVHGDGVCPLESALLEDSEQLILPLVQHAPSTSMDLPWYGDEK